MLQKNVVFFTTPNHGKSIRMLGMLKELGATVIILRSSRDYPKLDEYQIKIAVFDQPYLRVVNQLWRQRSITGNKVPGWVTDWASHCVAIEGGSHSGSFSDQEIAASEIYLWSLNHHFSLPEAPSNVTRLPRRDRLGKKQQFGGVDIETMRRPIFRHFNRNNSNKKRR